jgi:CheY-like chemotaxis protein
VDWPTKIGIFVASSGALAAAAKGATWVLGDLRAQLTRERAERQAAERDKSALQAQLAHTERDLARARRRVEDYRQATDALTSDDADTRAFFNGFDCGVVVSNRREGGTIVWLNNYLAQQLGYDRTALLDLLARDGWQALINHADVPRAQRAEATAHGGAVVDFVARYKRAPDVGGGWLRLRWDCKRYDENGLSLCKVTVLGVVLDPVSVLVVDNEPFYRKMLKLYLEHLGATVAGEVGSGRDAVECALRIRPDVVLMDLSMPGEIDGVEATSEILSVWSEAKVVGLTNFDQGSSEVERMLQAGAVACLAKDSLTEERLAAVLSKARGATNKEMSNG